MAEFKDAAGDLAPTTFNEPPGNLRLSDVLRLPRWRGSGRSCCRRRRSPPGGAGAIQLRQNASQIGGERPAGLPAGYDTNLVKSVGGLMRDFTTGPSPLPVVP